MIKVAVIGFGFMGVTHATHILKNSKVKLEAIVTRNAGEVKRRLESQAGNFRGGDADIELISSIPVYGTLRECLKHHALDAVHVCTHTDLHYELAREAIENHLHVLVEKPLTLRTEEATLLIHYARQERVVLMVGHVVRFMPAYRQLKKWIDSREFGNLEFVSLSRYSGVPTWGQWKEKHASFGSSGGALFDLLIHDIDFLQYALGKPGKINAVCLPGSLSMHDYVTAQWYYGNLVARLEGGNTFHPTFPFQAGYMARFENASVRYTSLLPEFISICTGEGITTVPAGDPNQGFYDEIDYFASCIINHTTPGICSPESSLETIRLCYDHI